MQILHDHTFLYIALTIGMINILVPLFFKSRILWKITLFLKKTWFFLSNSICLLNQLKKVCTFLYYQTFKYILHTILNMKSLVPLILKITTSKNITLFLKNNTLKKNVICLINRINKFCTFYMIAHFCRFHMWLEKEKNIIPVFFKIMTLEKKLFL